ncbi:MAG: heavy-metal-associated domain-containing protein [Fimbriimonadaceae bacterium]|nr:heavy-metal-associated domain-containing protein [Fimbriimonadaceae bacterium]
MNETTTRLSIKGMTCSHCVRAAKKALEGIPGVQTADVDLDSNSATVVHDPAVTSKAFAAALAEEGFTLA